MKRTRFFRLLSICLLLTSGWCAVAADADDIFGDWSLDLESETPAWMSVTTVDGKVDVRLRRYVGPDGPHRNVRYEDGRLTFTLRQNRKALDVKTVDVTVRNGQLEGVILSRTPDGSVTRDSFTGRKIPPMPTMPPDLTQVRFGHPTRLFNGRDLTGWRPHEADKINGWSVADGVLVNSTPKTDFSATGAYANLRTVAEFEDFWLHIEFLVENDRNSGVYLRGMYEAQVVDRDSRMQGVQGVGSIFGRIAPSTNAGRPGGQWQTYDLTLVDRHVTVVLNGIKVIDNQPVPGPTGGAVRTNPGLPGPILLQGDHTSVKYRDIYLAPVLQSPRKQPSQQLDGKSKPAPSATSARSAKPAPSNVQSATTERRATRGRANPSNLSKASTDRHAPAAGDLNFRKILRLVPASAVFQSDEDDTGVALRSRCTVPPPGLATWQTASMYRFPDRLSNFDVTIRF